MSWLLVITFTFQGQTTDRPVGLMVDQDSCVVAGGGMELVLEQANPGLEATWTCLAPPGVAGS